MPRRTAYLLSREYGRAKLYLSLGFLLTGTVDDEFGEPTYILKGAALERYRPR
jgi:hypothetical protein